MRYNPAITIQFWLTPQNRVRRGEQPLPTGWSLDFIVTGDVQRSMERIPLPASDQGVDFPREIAHEDRESIKQKLSEMISKAVDDLFSAD